MGTDIQESKLTNQYSRHPNIFSILSLLPNLVKRLVQERTTVPPSVRTILTGTPQLQRSRAHHRLLVGSPQERKGERLSRSWKLRQLAVVLTLHLHIPPALAIPTSTIPQRRRLVIRSAMPRHRFPPPPEGELQIVGGVRETTHFLLDMLATGPTVRSIF